MSYHHVLLVIHLLASAVWVGGHLLLLTSYVPRAIKYQNKSVILDFEARYERLGMSSLIVLVATGIAMALDYGILPGQWFSFTPGIGKIVSIKLCLLLCTILFALSAQCIVIPKLKKGSNNMVPLLFHITGVTLLGFFMLLFGSFIRLGGLS